LIIGVCALTWYNRFGRRGVAPIGLALSYLIYRAMTATMDFAYEFPWLAVAVSAAAVMLLTFGTMRYSRRKLGGISIVEAIRNEAI